MGRYAFYITVLVGVVWYAFLLYQQRQTVDENLFRDAELDCLEQNWNAARESLLTVLRDQPEHAGAHFYLGRAYIFGDVYRPVMAEGEFLTALRLYREQGRVSPIDRFPASYFEMMCFIEAAKANLVQVESYLRVGADMQALQVLLADCAYYADRARQINPRAPEVRDLDEILDRLYPRDDGDRDSRPANEVEMSPRMTV